MNPVKIKELFAGRIDRRIEEVIKVDQTNAQIVVEEIEEYVATDSIRRACTRILERYYETRNKPHEGVGIWISGFFGSGKSSFAKNVGLALENRDLLGTGAAERFGQKTADDRIRVLLNNITEQIPTATVVFDLSTDRGIRSGNQMLTEIMYRELLERLGYARDPDLAELEITLEDDGRLDTFKSTYEGLFRKDWDTEKGKVAFALSEASRVMHELDRDTYTAADSWVKAAKSRAELSANILAERAMQLLGRRYPDHALAFVIDEAGQFVARDVQKMLDLQGIVQALGRAGRGKLWIMVTSQERLSDVVGGIDDKRVELARLMDRFPQELQVHLEPSDISEVTSKRVLSKNAEAERVLRELFEQNRGRLTTNTRLTADIKLPELTAESFITLYPLLPYHVDLIIQIVSGLRMQGGASKHVGGANRTIIKLAQQLLINPSVALAEEPIGKLASVENVYDLVRGNIESEIRDKIDRIPAEVDHPLAQAVAKSVCLLHFVQSVHRTAENIAATLHPAVDADSNLPAVREALEKLEQAHKVRKGDDGYRIPTPAEDDWEKQRARLFPKPAEVNRIHGEIMEGLWEPQPSHNFLDTKLFKAALHLNGRPRVDGDIAVQVYLAEAGEDFDQRAAEIRSRSQVEHKAIFWIAAADERIDRATVEVFRSEQMLSSKERSAQTKAELKLVSEEKRKWTDTHRPALKKLLESALLQGTVYFQGNDRSPDDDATELGPTVNRLLGKALPLVFGKFHLAGERIQKKDLDALTTSENLHGLTPVFSGLRLLEDKGGKPVFELDTGPLQEVLGRIERDHSYGKAATGKTLADEFSGEPYGWSFEAVQLFALCLLRGGKVQVKSKGLIIESALTVEAKNVFGNNNLFRAASFEPKQTGVTFEDLLQAATSFQTVFGRDIPELEQGTVARTIREAVGGSEDGVRDQETVLRTHRLPGSDVLTAALDQMRVIRTASEENAILGFNGAYAEINEAIRRAKQLEQLLTEPALHRLDTARTVLDRQWSFLQDESDTSADLRERAAQLEDMLQRETFFQQLPQIDQHTHAIETAYDAVFSAAVQMRHQAYAAAVSTLESTPGWEQLEADQQQRIAQPLASLAKASAPQATAIPQIRADTDACPKRLRDAVEQVRRAIEGNRLVQVDATSYFRDGIETDEQLDAALTGLRDECAKHVGHGKKVFLK